MSLINLGSHQIHETNNEPHDKENSAANHRDVKDEHGQFVHMAGNPNAMEQGREAAERAKGSPFQASPLLALNVMRLMNSTRGECSKRMRMCQ